MGSDRESAAGKKSIHCAAIDQFLGISPHQDESSMTTAVVSMALVGLMAGVVSMNKYIQSVTLGYLQKNKCLDCISLKL